MKKTEGRRICGWGKGNRAVLGEREKRRLLQLGACVLVFLAVFAVKGVDRLTNLRNELSGILGTNANFGVAAERLGWALRTETPVGETVGRLLTEIFFPREVEQPAPRQDGPVFLAAERDLGGMTGYSAFLLGEKAAENLEQEIGTDVSADEPQLTPEPDPGSRQEETPEVIIMPYDGPELPEEASMDKYDLHLEKIVSPVTAAMTSNFGWRQDPFGEGQSFHHGLDMGVPVGTTVLAFSGGTVEYIGESDIYGQYLQIDHGNGVKSFYAHCSKLCVQQGQKVEAGEKVAESGETGNATGPHLHLELKREGIYLNPAYYVELLPS